MSEENFVTEIAKRDSFAVLASLIESDIEKYSEQGIIPQEATVRVGEFTVDAYIFSCDPNKTDELLPDADIEMSRTLDMVIEINCILDVVDINVQKDSLYFEDCTLEDKSLTLVVGKPSFVTVERDEKKEKDSDIEDDIEVNVLRVLETVNPIMERFSRITGGTKLCLHAYPDNNANFEDQAPVTVPNDETIHIFTNMRPAGDVEADRRYVLKCLGVQLHEKTFGARVVHPTKGRGTCVKDDKGTVLAQILDGNFYFLIPIFWNFDPDRTPLIFEKLLALTWETYRALPQEVSSPENATDSEYEDVVAGWVNSMRDFLRDALEEDQKEIDKFKKKLLELEVERRDKLTFFESFSSSSFVKESLERIPGDYEKICALPGVRRVSVVEEGIHIETGPLIIRGDDVDRKIAESYTIRLGGKGLVKIWTDTSLHPKGIPHPHMDEHGGTCFGSATNAILQAVIEHRMYDAVNYVMRWLKKGYTSELSVNKIDEWPSVDEVMSENTEKEVTHEDA